MSKYIYLAGPITGFSYEGVTEWRNEVSRKFLPGIFGVSPMRLKDFLKGQGPIGHSYESDVLSNGRAVLERDRYDCTHADGVIAVFPKDAPQLSVGTLVEVGWATANRIPTIVVSDDPRIVTHPLIKGNVGWIVSDLDTAVHVINGVFGPYVADGASFHGFSSSKAA